MQEDRMSKEEILANRIAAGRVIDTETCEIWDSFCDISDPYGVDPPPYEYQCVGRVIFVRSAESEGPVSIYELPEDKARAVHDRIKRGDHQIDDWMNMDWLDD